MDDAFHMASHARLEEKSDQLLEGQAQIASRLVALEVRSGLIGSICGAVVGTLIN